MTDLRQIIDRERLLAFAEARAVIAHARYGERELTDLELAHAVWHARVMQWNAAAIFRWKCKQLNRKPVAA